MVLIIQIKMTKLEEVKKLVEAGKVKEIGVAVQGSLDSGNQAEEILDAMIDSMGVIGERFSTGELFVPEMLMSAKSMNEGLDVLKPLLEGGGTKTIGKAIVGTVKGDLHDIGKNLVILMMRSVNIEVIDMGIDVSAEQFIEAIKEHNPKVVGLSALLTTTMNQQAAIIKAFEEAGLRDQIKVVIGGAPINKGWAEKIGADGFAADAAGAAAWAKACFEGM